MSNSDVVIRVEGLGKKYSLHHEQGERYMALRDVVARKAKAAGRLLNPFTLAGQLRKAQRQAAQERAESEEEFWALKDVSFEIRRGERVGIIGRNGAGKSTLLKILSRITEPTTGRVEICGRVASLLEVGTGFHPELTGRENIYLNGAILGMTRREIKAKFDEIVDFAEVEKFLDTPVKRYSSGMYVRLAFGVAAHLEPEILVVDEVLAVGDASFQAKCIGRMENLGREGRTVIFVSHNIGAISSLCSQGLLLSGGQNIGYGSVSSIVELYLSKGSVQTKYIAQESESLQKECYIYSALIINDKNVETHLFDMAEGIIIDIGYEIREQMYGLQVVITINRGDQVIFQTFDTDNLPVFQRTSPGFHRLRHRVPPMFLKAGFYSVSVHLGVPTKLIDYKVDLVQFEIEERSENTHDKGYSKNRNGYVVSPGEWYLVEDYSAHA